MAILELICKDCGDSICIECSKDDKEIFEKNSLNFNNWPDKIKNVYELNGWATSNVGYECGTCFSKENGEWEDWDYKTNSPKE